MEFEPSFTALLEKLKEFEQVEGVMLAGSAATGAMDRYSDYDLYVYLSADLQANARIRSLSSLFSYVEMDNRYWETEDDGYLPEGRLVEIIYRNISWIESMVADKVERYYADTGYSTCFWANILKSSILFDKQGRLAALKQRFDVPYPEQLREAVVKKNLPLLRGSIPSYRSQIEKAVLRNDLVSIQHRCAAFIASYADIIFALNRVPHPGEKKLLTQMSTLPLQPFDMVADLTLLLSGSAAALQSVVAQVDRCAERLEAVIVQHMPSCVLPVSGNR